MTVWHQSCISSSSLPLHRNTVGVYEIQIRTTQLLSHLASWALTGLLRSSGATTVPAPAARKLLLAGPDFSGSNQLFQIRDPRLLYLNRLASESALRDPGMALGASSGGSGALLSETIDPNPSSGALQPASTVERPGSSVSPLQELTSLAGTIARWHLERAASAGAPTPSSWSTEPAVPQGVVPHATLHLLSRALSASSRHEPSCAMTVDKNVISNPASRAPVLDLAHCLAVVDAVAGGKLDYSSRASTPSPLNVPFLVNGLSRALEEDCSGMSPSKTNEKSSLSPSQGAAGPYDGPFDPKELDWLDASSVLRALQVCFRSGCLPQSSRLSALSAVRRWLESHAGSPSGEPSAQLPSSKATLLVLQGLRLHGLAVKGATGPLRSRHVDDPATMDADSVTGGDGMARAAASGGEELWRRFSPSLLRDEPSGMTPRAMVSAAEALLDLQLPNQPRSESLVQYAGWVYKYVSNATQKNDKKIKALILSDSEVTPQLLLPSEPAGVPSRQRGGAVYSGSKGDPSAAPQAGAWKACSLAALIHTTHLLGLEKSRDAICNAAILKIQV